MRTSSIAIIGAGPAGLAAAIAARRLGMDVSVYEQAPGFRSVGGGILLHSNGQRVLHALGLLETFRPHARFTQDFFIEREDGRRLSKFDYRRISVPYNSGAVVLRHALQDHLLAAATRESVRVRLGCRLARLQLSPNAPVHLEFADGLTTEAALVIGADGVHSAVRAALASAGRIQVTERRVREAYLRCVAHVDCGDRAIREIWGSDGRRIGICPLMDSADPADASQPGRTYFFVPVPFGEWDEIRRHRLREWIESWSPYGDRVLRLLAAVPDWEAINYSELSDIECDRWSAPPVFLIGDAAHAMTPNLGQGANSAMVDSLVLIRLLHEIPDLESAATRYHQIRHAFVGRTQHLSRIIGKVAALKTPLARATRNRLLSLLDHLPPPSSSTSLLVGHNRAEDNYLVPDLHEIARHA